MFFKLLGRNKEKMDYIIAGLGNPGSEYAKTRHNAGFLAIDHIAKKCGASVDRLKFKALCGTAEIGGKKVLLMKPQTFMNVSGEAVGEAARFYKIPSERIMVIQDDIALPTGKLRIRKTGSDGGHNGIKSIISHLSSQNFIRFKIGVSDRENPNIPLADWVLGKFTDDEMKLIEAKYENIYKAAEMIMDGKFDLALSRYNG
ncbi:MAG: aminoacyl-tRNA hydrolase [Clostridia bacterium]|nr:aminoacyl-tRNA hydrolase [Clostridia bacterium]